MNQSKNKIPFHVVGIVLIFVLAILLLVKGDAKDYRAMPALQAKVYFEGEYRIGDGEWKPIVENQHIPATKGDVTLRGNFHLLAPDGEYAGVLGADIPISMFLNHISVTIYEGEEPYVMDSENPLIGLSSCGEEWIAHTFIGDGTEPIELLIHNPHRFGNENAVDELLSNVAIWRNIDLEREVISRGEPQKNAGLLFLIISFVLLGTALFSTLTRVENGKIAWLLGMTIFFAGTYFIYSSEGVSFWSESIVFNTTVLGLSMMFCFLFVSMTIVHLLKRTKKLGVITASLLGVFDAILIAVPILGNMYFYDTLVIWVLGQIVANISLSVCLVIEFASTKGKRRWINLGLLLPMIAFIVDVYMTWKGAWQGGMASGKVFAVLVMVTMVMILRFIPRGVNVTAKEKEFKAEKMALDAQLAESRISTMISQIHPHFIYNTLGSIEQLCEIDPKKAGELVHNFSKYLRGNFRELDNPKPISISQEMEHVRYYISIEKVRFPDMTFTFEMKSEDFSLPALTVQPIVENAVKHGLMKLQDGGTIHVKTFETDTHYCISVEDDGAGFDTEILKEEREHVGIRNIRGRLEAMVRGTLEIESTQGVGTKVLIKIPKEGQE